MQLPNDVSQFQTKFQRLARDIALMDNTYSIMTPTTRLLQFERRRELAARAGLPVSRERRTSWAALELPASVVFTG